MTSGRRFDEDDGGVAYLATSVALATLMVSMFALPLVTYSGTASLPPDTTTTSSPFLEEARDVYRLFEVLAEDLEFTMDAVCVPEPGWTPPEPDPLDPFPPPDPRPPAACTPLPNTPCNEDPTEVLSEIASQVQPLVVVTIHVEWSSGPCNASDSGGLGTTEGDLDPTFGNVTVIGAGGEVTFPYPTQDGTLTFICRGYRPETYPGCSDYEGPLG